MSRVYEIACFETKKAVMIGQGKTSEDFNFWSAQEDTLDELGKFFREHINKPLYIVDSEVVADLFSMPTGQVKEILEEHWPYMET